MSQLRGRAGAKSTQARAPTCGAPPPLALHPRLDLCGFRVSWLSDQSFVLFPICVGRCDSEVGHTAALCRGKKPRVWDLGWLPPLPLAMLHPGWGSENLLRRPALLPEKPPCLPGGRASGNLSGTLPWDPACEALPF